MENNGQSDIVAFWCVVRSLWQINSTASWPTVPPPDPNSGNLVLFSDVKIQDLKITWGRGTVKSSIHWHFWRNRLFLLTKNALLEKGLKNLGMGRPPPLIQAMPERKRFFSIDVFPYSLTNFCLYRVSFSHLYVLMYLYSYAQAWGQKGQNGGVGAPPDTPDGRRAN